MKRLEMFSWQDYEAIKKHLEKMSLKGYKLKRTGLLWEYEKITPRMIHYDVVYFPKRNELDKKITKDDVEYFDYCEVEGWEYVGGSGQMRIFSSEEKKPTPIETDSKERFDCINKLGRREMLIGVFLLFLCMVNLLALQVYGSEELPRMIMTTIYIVGIAIGIIVIISYWDWYFRAKKSLESHMPLPKSRSVTLLPSIWVMLILMVILFGIWYLSIIYINLQYKGL